MQYQPSQSTRISCIKFHTDTSAFTEATACKVRRTDIHPEINFGLWAYPSRLATFLLHILLLENKLLFSMQHVGRALISIFGVPATHDLLDFLNKQLHWIFKGFFLISYF